MIIKETILNLVHEYIESKAMFIIELNISPSNKISLVVDSIQGVSIDDCVTLSRMIEMGLDRNTEDFELEVSSAGIGSPFKVIQQYHKNIGKDIEVVLKTGIKIKGVLQSVTNEGFTISYQKLVKTDDKKRKQLLAEDKFLKFDETSKVYNIINF